MHGSSRVHVHQPPPFLYTAFLFQIHSSRITEHPIGLQPLGDIVNMHKAGGGGRAGRAFALPLFGQVAGHLPCHVLGR